MADKYPNFAALARNERSGIDFDVLVRRARPAFAIVAPHGGGIEPGTSEIADAIAGEKFSFYTFEGLKSSGNADLHITSMRVYEPMCLTVLGHSTIVMTLHGEHSEDDSEGVFIGDLDTALGAHRHRVDATRLRRAGTRRSRSAGPRAKRTFAIEARGAPAFSWNSHAQCANHVRIADARRS